MVLAVTISNIVWSGWKISKLKDIRKLTIIDYPELILSCHVETYEIIDKKICADLCEF